MERKAAKKTGSSPKAVSAGLKPETVADGGGETPETGQEESSDIFLDQTLDVVRYMREKDYSAEVVTYLLYHFIFLPNLPLRE